ncbi:MAG: hypothetical protein AAGH19_08115 [Pseudomonadota bacterium]
MNLKNTHLAAILSLGALVLTGCGSQFTDFQAPDAVGANEQFGAAVEHEWLEDFSPSEAVPNAQFMFIVVAPDEWTMGPVAEYEGTMNNGDFSLNLDFDLLPAPPVTNYIDYVEQGGDTPSAPFPDSLDCVQYLEEVGIGPGFTAYYYLSTEPFPEEIVVLGDGGGFSWGMQSGPNAGGYNVTVLHALYGEYEGNVGQTLTDVTQCTLLNEGAQENNPSFAERNILQVESAAPPPSPDRPPFVQPVPVDGALALLVLASLMLLAGFYIGRKP